MSDSTQLQDLSTGPEPRPDDVQGPDPVDTSPNGQLEDDPDLNMLSQDPEDDLSGLEDDDAGA